jgi:succinoglycan biosynthesis transport protein ExoP
MEIRQYWNLFGKWLWLLVLGALLAGSASFFISRNMTPVYEASTTLLVTPGSAQALDNYNSLIASERLAQTYAQLLTSASVLQDTYLKLGAGPAGESANSRPSAAFSVSAEPVRNTQLIQLRVTGTDPVLITDAANTVVQVFIQWQAEIQQSRYADTKANLAAEMERVQANIRDTETEIGALQTQGDAADPSQLSRLQDQLAQYRNSYSVLLNSFSNIGLAEANAGDTLTVVSPAATPSAPVRPQVKKNTLLAAILGALLAGGVAFLVEYLDDTVKVPEDLRDAGVSVVAAVQRMSSNSRNTDRGLLAVSEPNSLVAEAYRTLRTNLQFSSLDKPLRSLVVTSAVATEGKTTTSANLAVVMAQAGRRVILVDGDLRRPSAHKLFGLPNREGLTTALVQDPGTLNGYLQETGMQNLRVLTSGPIPPNPQELLGSQRMEELLARLGQEADIVLVDTPPSLIVADANVLAARTDGVLMVVNSGRTRRVVVQQAVGGLRQVGANVVGAVLNMVNVRGGRSYYYYYSVYSHYYGDQEQGGKRSLWGRLRRPGKRGAAQEDRALPHTGDKPELAESQK